MIKLFENLLKFSLILLSPLNLINCRELNVSINPDCPLNCTQYKHPVNLFHIQSKGDKDIIHYVWSSITCIPPTLLIVETDLTSKININWDHLLGKMIGNCPTDKDLNGAIQFSGNVSNSIGFQFSRLFFFNDNNKKGAFDKNDTIIEVDWSNLIWQQSKQVPTNGDSVQISFRNSNESLFDLYNGSIAFDLRVDKNDGRNEELPHLAFTQKSVSLQISANNFQTENYFKQGGKEDRPRLMADIFIMTGGHTSKEVPKFDGITSIDDEYTPGVFRRFVLDLKNGDKKVKNAFLSWKPIAYNDDERIIANTLDVIQGEIQTIDWKELSEQKSRILESFFDVQNNTKYKFNLTFGAVDDDTYYNEKRYNAFSLVVGVDSAPDEELSFLVKIIIVIGFGLPLLVMVVSALYLIVRKIRKRKFNDLLLSQSQHNLND